MPLMGDRGGSPVGADERLRFLFSVARDPFLILDNSNGGGAVERCTIIDCNRAALDLLGYRADQLTGNLYSSVFAPNSEDPGPGVSGDGDRLLRRADGQVLVVEEAAEFIESAGRPLVLLSLHDVTTPRLLEKALMRMQQMDNLGVVSGSVVHDFRNLLVSIGASAELGLQESEDGETVRQRLEDIVASVLRASELVDRILPSSRVKERPLVPVNLETVVAGTVAMIRPSLPSGHAVRLEFPPGLPTVMGDDVQLRQMVTNLVLNASQAIGDRTGNITLAASHVGPGGFDAGQFQPETAELGHGRWILFEVRDDGRGIDSVTRARIFEPLFTTRTSGTGLGLTAVLVAIRRHRGAISVRSRPGRGATFRVLLPAGGEEQAPSQ